MRLLVLFLSLLFFVSAFGQFSENIITAYQPCEACRPSDVQYGDFDKDGDFDIVVFTTNGKIKVFNNEGQRMFNAGQIVDEELSVFSNFISSLFDVDDDGYLDIIVYLDLDQIVWYKNDGSGNFSSGIDFPDGILGSSVFAADFDNDEDYDIIGQSSNNFGWYENLGNGNFSMFREDDVGYEEFTYMLPDDLDNDGDVDIVFITHQRDAIGWFENLGAENFANGTLLVQDLVLEFHPIFSQSEIPIAIGDLDNDGYKDLIVAESTLRELTWYKNDGNENFAEIKNISLKRTNDFTAVQTRLIRLIDEDNDGDLDIFSTGEEGETPIF